MGGPVWYDAPMSTAPNTYRIIIETTIEAYCPDEAQVTLGNLLAGRDMETPPGRDFPLTGPGSFAPDRKVITEVRFDPESDTFWPVEDFAGR